MKHHGDSMAAKLLAVSAPAYAAYASNRLLEKVPDVKLQFGESAFGQWKDRLCQSINELSVAIAEQEPALFVSRVRWSRDAFLAREIPENLLRESLVCLSEIMEEELPEAYRQVTADYIAAALKSLEDSENKSTEFGSTELTSKLAMQYLVQVLEGNSSDAIKLIVDARDKGMSLEDTYQALMAAQTEMGRMWHHAEISVAEEHFVTHTTERAMAVLAYKAERQASNGRTVVSAGVADNAHDVGVRVVSDFFEFAGWRAVCLGGDLSAIHVAQAVQYFNASLVLLSASLSTQLKAVRETVQFVRELDLNCKIMVGGTGLQDAPNIWRQLGADAYAATPAEAVRIGSRLTHEREQPLSDHSPD